MRTTEQIAEDLRAQDNLATAIPIFIVQRQRRDYGYDRDWSDNRAWLDDEGNEVPKTKAARLERAYQASGDERRGYRRTHYQDRWEFVTACFTRKGCEDYLAANGHNLTGPMPPRIYVESGYRNSEWQALREMLLALRPGGG